MSTNDDAKKPDTQEPQGIVIIANRPKAFESAANFLSRRGHPCSVVGTVKQGLQVISQKNSQYVFLSWNLKNNNAIKTSQLFSKNFGLTVIVYAEATDSKTAAELAASHLPEIMQAPVSGPGIYMKIQRIVKAKEEAALSKDLDKNSANAAASSEETTTEIIRAEASDVPVAGDWELSRKDKETGQNIWRFKAEETATMKGKSGVFTFKGEKAPIKGSSGKWESETGATEFTFEAKAERSDAADARLRKRNLSEEEIEAIAQMISKPTDSSAGGLSGTESAEESEDDNSFGSILRLGKERKKKAEALVLDIAKEQEKEGGTLDLRKEQTEGTDHIFKQEGLKDSPELSAKQESSAATEYNTTQEGPRATEYSINQDGPKATEYSIAQQGQQTKEHSASAGGGRDRKTADGRSILQKAPVKIDGAGAKSLLAQAAVRALEESVETVEGQDVNSLGAGKKVVVMTISSTRFSGYLIATSSNQQNIDISVVEKLKHKIPTLLHQSGEALRDFEIVNVDIGPVNFKEWSAHSAEFTAVAAHHDEEWLVMFVPDKNIKFNLEHTQQKMIAVELTDVLPSLPMPFNLYIFFPLNERFFKYVARDKQLSPEQRTRMEKAKVSKFYIHSSEETEFKMFCVQNRINAKIVDFITLKNPIAS